MRNWCYVDEAGRCNPEVKSAVVCAAGEHVISDCGITDIVSIIENSRQYLQEIEVFLPIRVET